MTSPYTSLLGKRCLADVRREHLLSAGRRRKISSSALHRNEPLLTSTLLQLSALQTVTGEHRLQWGFCRAFLHAWLSKSVKIRVFDPGRLPESVYTLQGGIWSPLAPALCSASHPSRATPIPQAG